MGLEKANIPFAFKCGTFFSAAPPINLKAMQRGRLQQSSSWKDDLCIGVPTAHIWDPNDVVHPGFGEVLHTLCF
jgi:hypothetical protein